MLRPSTVPVRAALVTFVVVTGLLLAGCAAGAPAAPSSSEGPLDEYFTAISDRGDGRSASERNARIEDVTAACMKAQGFDYTPARPLQDAADSVEWLPDDSDWVAAYGYGLVDNPAADQAPSGDAADPNSAYLDSLPEGERQAYLDTLWGAQEDGGIGEGCYAQAYDEVAGDDPTQLDEFQPLMDAVSTFWQSVADDPGFAQLDAEWSECMALAGHDFRKQGDAEASISAAVDVIYAEDPDATADSPALQTIAANEIALAQDDLECRRSTDYTARAQEIEDALQQRFVDDHRAELDALVASAQESR